MLSINTIEDARRAIQQLQRDLIEIRTRTLNLPTSWHRGGNDTGFILVGASSDGGSDGTPGAAATWTYTLTDANSGAVIATSVPLFRQRRIAGPCAPGSHGIAYRLGGSQAGYGPAGSANPLILWDIDEQYGGAISVGVCVS